MFIDEFGVVDFSSGIFKSVLYLAGFLLLLNANSFPLVWHYKSLFRHVWRFRFNYAWNSITLVGKSKSMRKELKVRYMESISPVGVDPWAFVIKSKGFAGLDECDFNLHLNNASYPKLLDVGRIDTCLQYFPNFYHPGVWMALKGTHFTFYREIPVLSSYETRTYIGSWDEKWIYLVTRFVTRPKNKKSKPSMVTNSNFIPDAHTPTTETETGTNTPSNINEAKSPGAVSALAESALRKEEPDGTTLNCVAVAELCFKLGRITVPPAIALAMNGFSVASPDGTPYSHDNPPPHWGAVQKLLSLPNATQQQFLRSGWREVPVEERWWEQALGGAVEKKRLVNLELMRGVQQGMEGAKAVYQTF